MIYFVYNDASLFTMTFEKFLVKDKTTALCETKKTTKVNFEKLLGQQVLKNHYRAYSLTWPASMQIYGNKRKFLHKKRVQLPQDLFGAPIWPPWRHVKIAIRFNLLQAIRFNLLQVCASLLPFLFRVLFITSFNSLSDYLFHSIWWQFPLFEFWLPSRCTASFQAFSVNAIRWRFRETYPKLSRTTWPETHRTTQEFW